MSVNVLIRQLEVDNYYVKPDKLRYKNPFLLKSSNVALNEIANKGRFQQPLLKYKQQKRDVETVPSDLQKTTRNIHRLIKIKREQLTKEHQQRLQRFQDIKDKRLTTLQEQKELLMFGEGQGKQIEDRIARLKNHETYFKSIKQKPRRARVPPPISPRYDESETTESSGIELSSRGDTSEYTSEESNWFEKEQKEILELEKMLKEGGYRSSSSSESARSGKEEEGGAEQLTREATAGRVETKRHQTEPIDIRKHQIEITGDAEAQSAEREREKAKRTLKPPSEKRVDERTARRKAIQDILQKKGKKSIPKGATARYTRYISASEYATGSGEKTGEGRKRHRKAKYDEAQAIKKETKRIFEKAKQYSALRGARWVPSKG